MNTVPQVSIIIPVYNAGSHLPTALRSLDCQTYRRFEVVIVDDGSTDAHTRRVLERIERDAYATIHRTSNRGPGAARNFGIERARGAYILPLDADDELGPTFLARTVAVLDAEPETGIVATWASLVGGHAGVWRTGEFSLEALLTRSTIPVTSLFRRSVWEAVGGFDATFLNGGEDWEFWLSAAARGVRAHIVAEPLFIYRRVPDSRELRARAPHTAASVMRQIVAKHRALYTTHLDTALAQLYAQYSDVCIALEHVYRHPLLRTALRLRALFGQRTP